jgi:hypothetical protein
MGTPVSRRRGCGAHGAGDAVEQAAVLVQVLLVLRQLDHAWPDAVSSMCVDP